MDRAPSPGPTTTELAWNSPINMAIGFCFGFFVLGVAIVLYQATWVITLPSLSIQATVALGTLFCLLHGLRSMGGRRIGDLLGLTLVLTLAAELVGVLTGLLFGEYQYNGHLGNQFLGLVPYVIPLAWFMMLYPSYVIALRVASSGKSARPGNTRIAVLGACIMTTWDLVIDPVMVKIAFWEWEGAHYFGVPFTNYLGWLFISFLVLYAFGLRHPPDGPAKALASSGRIVSAYYGIVGMASAVAAISVGLVFPAVIGITGMSLWVLLGWSAARRREAFSV